MSYFRAENLSLRFGGLKAVDAVSFAVNPLPTNAAFAGIPTDIAVLAKKDGKGTGNPLRRGYHAHG